MVQKSNGKVITLGSATLDILTLQPIRIDSITVTWSGASDGNVLLEDIAEVGGDHLPGNTILSCKTIGFASATALHHTLSQVFPFYGATFNGLTVTAMTGVDGDQGVQILVR